MGIDMIGSGICLNKIGMDAEEHQKDDTQHQIVTKTTHALVH
jgi:hypothetical protein